MAAHQARGWYGRGYLPHYDDERTTQMLTFRLADSYPAVLLERVRAELAARALSRQEEDLAWRKKAMAILDAGYGACWLRDPRIAGLVQDAFLFFDGVRYGLDAWCVMPNHCHVLITQEPGWSLESVLHSWQSFTANKANALLGRTGRFWARGCFDRYIRNARHYASAVSYIERNPVVAGLCDVPEAWPFGSAFLKTRPLGAPGSASILLAGRDVREANEASLSLSS